MSPPSAFECGYFGHLETISFLHRVFSGVSFSVFCQWPGKYIFSVLCRDLCLREDHKNLLWWKECVICGLWILAQYNILHHNFFQLDNKISGLLNRYILIFMCIRLVVCWFYFTRIPIIRCVTQAAWNQHKPIRWKWLKSISFMYIRRALSCISVHVYDTFKFAQYLYDLLREEI